MLIVGQLAALVILILQRWIITPAGLTHARDELKTTGAPMEQRVCCGTPRSTSPALKRQLWVSESVGDHGVHRTAAAAAAGVQPQRRVLRSGAVAGVKRSNGKNTSCSVMCLKTSLNQTFLVYFNCESYAVFMGVTFTVLPKETRWLKVFYYAHESLGFSHIHRLI